MTFVVGLNKFKYCEPKPTLYLRMQNWLFSKPTGWLFTQTQIENVKARFPENRR